MWLARNSVGGVGAILFLSGLGAIACFVAGRTPPPSNAQRSHSSLVSAPADPDPQKPSAPAKNPSPASPERSEPPASVPASKPPPPPVWSDRLDLRKLSPQPVFTSPAKASKLQALVQDLPDGQRVLYTLDPTLQKKVRDIFASRELPYAGAVVLDLQDNRVLAMVGYSHEKPEIDPFELVLTPWAPAASTFKLVTAAALVDKGAVTPNTKACFSGGLSGIEDEMLDDVPKRDTRCESLSAAVAHSHNIVMGKLALRHLSQQALIGAARDFYFDTTIPFIRPVQVSPIEIPKAPKARAKVAAGFWHTNLSPLHGALMASIFARGGQFQAPLLVAQRRVAQGPVQSPAIAPPTQRVAKKTADRVAKMMVNTTTEGTARSSFFDKRGRPYLRGIKAAGKTGSLTGKSPPHYNYNWFVGFAPAKDPKIAFAVLLANPPKWRIKAHYAARRIVQIYSEQAQAIRDRPKVFMEGKKLKLPAKASSKGKRRARKAASKSAAKTRQPPASKSAK